MIVDNHPPLSILIVLLSKNEMGLFVERFDCERGYEVRDCCFGLSCDSVVFRHRGCIHRLLITRESITSKGMEK